MPNQMQKTDPGLILPWAAVALPWKTPGNLLSIVWDLAPGVARESWQAGDKKGRNCKGLAI